MPLKKPRRKEPNFDRIQREIADYEMADNDYMMEIDFSPKKDDAKAKSPKSATAKKPGKRGRKPAKIDTKAKLERSRQSARECRARKKLRYQYLEELVASREKAIHQLRSELEMFKKWCQDLDEGNVPEEIQEYMERDRVRKAMRGHRTRTISVTTDDDDDTASQP